MATLLPGDQTVVTAPPPNPPETEAAEAGTEIVQKALKRFKLSSEAEDEMRREMQSDLDFRASDQWPDNIKRFRLADNRPCLTINRLPQFIRQVTNFQRKARPAVRINPVDNGADVDTAQVLQGLIRHIETRSGADVVYATACDHQTQIGRGWIRIHYDYVNERSFEQELMIQRVRNPFSVYPDPACQEIDYSDARFLFVSDMMPREEFERLWPEASVLGLGAAVKQNRDPDWVTGDQVRVAEYWWVEEVDDTLVLLGNPLNPQGRTTTMLRSEYTDEVAKQLSSLKVLSERPTRRRVVKWALINQHEILQGNEDRSDGAVWPGTAIPFVPVIGEEIDNNGRVDLRGMIRDAKDPQRMYNYWVSNATETIALAPRAPYIAAEGQIEGHENQWKQANTRNFAVLQYKPTAAGGGQLVPPPQRNVQEPPIGATIAAIGQADSDLKSVTGFHEPSIGERSNERSGKAIQALQQRGELGSSHFLGNLGWAVRRVGQILVDLIPHVYEAPRVFRILGEDDTERAVVVGRFGDERPESDQLPDGIKGAFDPSVGIYDVTVDVGPSYQTKRQETVDAMTGFVQAYPNAFPLVGDLLTKHMDHPLAREMSTRLKALLPRSAQEDDDNLPEEARAAVAQARQEAEQMRRQLQELEQQLAAKAKQTEGQGQIKMLELQSRERIEAMRARTDLVIAELKAEGELDRAQLKAKVDTLRDYLKSIDSDNAAEREQAERAIDRAFQADQRAQDRAAQARPAAPTAVQAPARTPPAPIDNAPTTSAQ